MSNVRKTSKKHGTGPIGNKTDKKRDKRVQEINEKIQSAKIVRTRITE